MYSIRWLYFILVVLVLCDIVLAIAQDHDIQKFSKQKSNNVDSNNDIAKLIDYIFGTESNIQGRHFAQKRLQFLLMPIMFKLGVMTTILIVLTVISLKGLTIGVMLLVLKLSSLFGKFYTSIQPHHQAPWLPSPQPVHLHVHGDGGHYNHLYSTGESISPTENDNYIYKGQQYNY